MKRLYLLRHGQTEFNVKKLVQGRCDSPLTDLGRHQAQTAAAWLKAHGVVHVSYTHLDVYKRQS